MSTRREFLPPRGQRRTPSAAARAAPFDYPTTQVGVVGHTTVCYALALGQPGLSLAQQFLGAVSRPYDDMQTLFGLPGEAVTVVIAPLSGTNDGSGGAYHYGCDFTSGGVLYLDATFASTTVAPLDLEVGLYVAELSESFMGAQGTGWGCGFSNGEGLSRSWAEQTDQDAVSTGCAVVYLYWLRSLGYASAQIVQAGSTTLAANYQALTGKTTAYQDLLAAVQGVAVTSDNPFSA